MLHTSKLFQASLIFESKARVYRVEYRCVCKLWPLYGRLHALPANIRLGWKVLQWTNTKAYYEYS
jgi:hypothetical protein